MKKRGATRGDDSGCCGANGAQSGDSRTLHPRLPCRQRAGAVSCMSSHWATGKSSRTWSGAGAGDRAKGGGELELSSVRGRGRGQNGAGWGAGAEQARACNRTGGEDGGHRHLHLRDALREAERHVVHLRVWL